MLVHELYRSIQDSLFCDPGKSTIYHDRYVHQFLSPPISWRIDLASGAIFPITPELQLSIQSVVNSVELDPLDIDDHFSSSSGDALELTARVLGYATSFFHFSRMRTGPHYGPVDGSLVIKSFSSSMWVTPVLESNYDKRTFRLRGNNNVSKRKLHLSRVPFNQLQSKSIGYENSAFTHINADKRAVGIELDHIYVVSPDTNKTFDTHASALSLQSFGLFLPIEQVLSDILRLTRAYDGSGK